MLPVCLVLTSTSCLVPVHCVQPCVSIYLGPLCPWALLCQITVYHMFHLLLHSWQLSFLYFMLQTRQRSSLSLISSPVSDCFTSCICPSLQSKLSVSHTRTSDSNLSHFNFSIYWVLLRFYASTLLLLSIQFNFCFYQSPVRHSIQH